MNVAGVGPFTPSKNRYRGNLAKSVTGSTTANHVTFTAAQNVTEVTCFVSAQNAVKEEDYVLVAINAFDQATAATMLTETDSTDGQQLYEKHPIGEPFVVRGGPFTRLDFLPVDGDATTNLSNIKVWVGGH